jgi:hypothetical protein
VAVEGAEAVPRQVEVGLAVQEARADRARVRASNVSCLPLPTLVAALPLVPAFNLVRTVLGATMQVARRCRIVLVDARLEEESRPSSFLLRVLRSSRVFGFMALMLILVSILHACDEDVTNYVKTTATISTTTAPATKTRLARWSASAAVIRNALAIPTTRPTT